MSTEMEETWVTSRGWPSPRTGPHALVFRWAMTLDRNRIECVGLELCTAAYSGLIVAEGLPTIEQGTRVPLDAELWRKVPVREEIERERSSLARHMDPDDPRSEPWRRRRPRGGFLRRGDFQKVADVYTDALRRGEPPRLAVAVKFQLSPSAAAKRIARAREHGLLPPTTRGRAEKELS